SYVCSSDLLGEQAGGDVRSGLGDAQVFGQCLGESFDLALGRHEPVWADRQPDAGVPLGGQVPHRQVHAAFVVTGDERGFDVGGVAVDEHHRHAAAGQALVALQAGLGIGVQTRDEDDPGHFVVQHDLHVLVLGVAAV